MDINLIGETDGIEAARLIGPAAAVIFTTGYTEAETRRRAMELEPLGYLIKPVDIAEVDRLLGSLAT
jgi:DNA-binding NarL/FixJ family response regulator